MISYLIAGLRRLRTAATVFRARSFLSHGRDLHIGRNATLWAPDRITIGSNVYIGKDVDIECNCEIGDFVLIANRVAFVGRHDHDFRAVGFPVRYAPWIGSARHPSPWRHEKVTVESDAWLGYGVTVLTGVRIGRGAIVAAGAVVTKDVPPYSIVAGSPAKEVGRRFTDSGDIERHEASIRNGRFAFSERGYDRCIISPAVARGSIGHAYVGPPRKVTVLQHRLLHYRVGFFDKLRKECERHGIELRLVHGQPSPRESLKKDTGVIPWADQVRNRWIEVLGRDVLWQPFPRDLRDSDLIVIMQENRILSNYPLMLRRYWGRAKVAYWGHGRNFQSHAPSGLRERWKRLLLTRVDWWFAYTGLTKRILIENGFPAGRITCLNNAIDNDGFLADLESVSPDSLDNIRRDLDLLPDAPLGVYCGSLYPDKRLDLLAEAAERIHAAVPTFRLVVIGDGPSRSQLELRLADNAWVRCVGAKKGIEKAAYFRLGKVILSPGAVGLHVLDAFCAGLPMFTTPNAKHGPEIEYLEHPKNGFIAPDDPSGYADAVISLLQDEERYTATCAAAREAGRRYTLDNMVSNFLQGMQACLSETRHATGMSRHASL